MKVGNRFVACWLVGIWCIGATPSVAHQAFRLNSPQNTESQIDPPTIISTAFFEHEHCSIFREANSGNLYALPSRFYHAPSRSNTVFGAALESERQDHLVVVSVFGVDAAKMEECFRALRSSTGETAPIAIYPAPVADVSLISDPNDHLVLKFNYGIVASNTLSVSTQIMTILQSSGRRNVSTLKRLLPLQLDAVVYIRVRVNTPSGGTEVRAMTVPVSLGAISVSSQGL